MPKMREKRKMNLKSEISRKPAASLLDIRMTKREQEELLEKLRLQKREYERTHKVFLSDDKNRYLF